MNVQRSKAFDLGADTGRMKPADAARQNATVDRLLGRLYADDRDQCLPFQLLADEVGMGKTFVALGTAFSLLEHLEKDRVHPHVRGCVPKVLVLAPSSGTLYKKWLAEVGDFVKRCVKTPSSVSQRFESVGALKFDETVGALNNAEGPSLVISYTGAFTRRLTHEWPKMRITLSALFRSWGNRLPHKERRRLLQALEANGWNWGLDQDQLSGSAGLPISTTQLTRALRCHRPALADDILRLIRPITANYVRNRAQRIASIGLDEKLRRLYRQLAPLCIEGDLPLVILDEAHNWKNHPRGYREFRWQLAPYTRRLLMLSATPFQLHPREVLALFHAGEALRGSRKPSRVEKLRRVVAQDREQVIGPVLDASALASKRFVEAWRRLPPSVDGRPSGEVVGEEWAKLEVARATLDLETGQPGAASASTIRGQADHATSGVHPDIRELMRRALRLYAFNRNLSSELGRYVVRHRRSSDHRVFQVGEEFVRPERAIGRTDRHILHPAHGLDVHGKAELPHYLLMRAISELKQGRGRTALGSSLTGCYSTLLLSAQGRRLQEATEGSRAKLYVDLLTQSVGRRQDKDHPKVKPVVDSIVDAWEQGEKTLVFCFRVNTAERLHDILRARIAKRLRSRLRRYIGSKDKLSALRGRLSRRDGDLVVIGLDRVLPSVSRARGIPEPDASLQDEDLCELAGLCLQYGVTDLDRLDRVFFHRAQEHLVAKRLLGTCAELDDVLRLQAERSWVEHAYGLQEDTDKRGVHTVYRIQHRPTVDEVGAFEEQLRERRARAGERSAMDAVWSSPNLWLGPDDRLHRYLGSLGLDESGLVERREILAALRDAVRWEGILLRLVVKRQEGEGWADTLVRGFHTSPRGRSESMLERFAVFTQDLVNASGSVLDASKARGIKFSATRLQAGQSPVRLVKGGSRKTRERVFQGFNSPLLPEVLVCTSVGQEGIDLHRHCSRVIHYDLAWNPAVIEQRTGRVDRIGSKTFRERERDPDSLLEIGVPFLAGTYDERMFEELRLRAQTFEVLTGGELSKGNRHGDEEDEGVSQELRLVALPSELVADLRVELGVPL